VSDTSTAPARKPAARCAHAFRNVGASYRSSAVNTQLTALRRRPVCWAGDVVRPQTADTVPRLPNARLLT
jgi:hypothetical protein